MLFKPLEIRILNNIFLLKTSKRGSCPAEQDPTLISIVKLSEDCPLFIYFFHRNIVPIVGKTIKIRIKFQLYNQEEPLPID